MAKPFIIWMGAALDPSGYGEATRNYVLGLDDEGADVKLMNRRFWRGTPVELRNRLARIKALTDRAVPENVENPLLVFNLTPENYFIGKDIRKHICLTTFETDSIPEHWLLPLRAMDIVFTYSQFNKETFTRAGITRPIKVVPHGVDVDRFRPGLDGISSIKEKTRGKFVFGCNFEWTNRKNPKALLTAYYRNFTNSDDVILLLKCYYQYPLEKSVEEIRQNIANIKKELKVDAKTAPPVLLVTDILKDDEMPSLYGSMDCFVLPTRGEGWGLPLTEAMACGLPTIATNWSGNTEFMTDENSFLIDYKLVDVPDKDVSRQPHYKNQKWAEANVEHLGALMRKVYEQQDYARAKGRVARDDMCDKWTWKHACQKLNNEFNHL